MSAESAPQSQRSMQADELIKAVNRNSVACTALAASNGVLLLAVNALSDRIDEMLARDDDETEHDEDCDDEDCDGECLDEPDPLPRRKPRRKK